MAVKGTLAKENVKKIIIESFNKNYIGENSNKLYVLADDGGEKVQIAISMTCPKVGLETAQMEEASTNSFIEGVIPKTPVVEMTPEEEANIQNLLKRLNL